MLEGWERLSCITWGSLLRLAASCPRPEVSASLLLLLSRVGMYVPRLSVRALDVLERLSVLAGGERGIKTLWWGLKILLGERCGLELIWTATCG